MIKKSLRLCVSLQVGLFHKQAIKEPYSLLKATVKDFEEEA